MEQCTKTGCCRAWGNNPKNGNGSKLSPGPVGGRRVEFPDVGPGGPSSGNAARMLHSKKKCARPLRSPPLRPPPLELVPCCAQRMCKKVGLPQPPAVTGCTGVLI